jgi:hypothetical protein
MAAGIGVPSDAVQAITVTGSPGSTNELCANHAVSPELTLSWQPSVADTLAAQWSSAAQGGRTPFVFDRIEAAHAVSFAVTRRTQRRTIHLRADFDLSTHSLYGWEMGYAHRIHCLEPGLMLRRHGHATSFGVTLGTPGVGGGF